MKSAVPTHPAIAAVDRENPWPGLSTFTEEQRAFFHGRDDEGRELARRLERKTLTVLFGQSGLGKSSLLQAGVFPRLRTSGFCPIYVRLDHSPDAPALVEQIKPAVFAETSLMGTWSQTGAAVPGETLWEFFHHRDDVLRGGAGQLLTPILVFDQFEELFTLGAAADATRARAQAFLTELADLVENRPPATFEARLDAGTLDAEKFDFARSDYRVLISLREDYLPHLESLKGAMPSLMQNRLRLTRLSGAQALEAVVKPAPGLVTDDVARAIVAFVSGRADLASAEVEPALLSLVCRELNHRRRTAGAGTIDAALLEGSRDTILVEFYERTLADQSPAVRHFVEDELLTDSGYRENIALERAQKLLASAGAPAAALDTLVARRLLRIEERLDVRRIELTHDVLCGVVRASRDARKEREARAAEERRRAETEAQLAAARAQEAAAKRAAIRARLIATGSAALAVVAVGAAVWGYVNFRRAEEAEDRATAERDRVQVSRGEAEKLVTFLLDDLHRQLEPTGRIEIVSGLAKRALAYFDALPAELRDARSDRYRGIALSRLGLALSQQGKTLEAEEPLRLAETVFQALREKGDRSAELTADLAAVLRQQSRNAYLQNRTKPSVEIGERGAELIGSLATQPGAPAAVRFEHARTQMNLGFVLMRDRQNDSALACLQRSGAGFRQLMDEPEWRQRASILYSENVAWFAEVLRFVGRGAEIPPLLDAALRIADEAVEREAGNLGALRSRALLRSRRAVAANDAYDYATAEKMGRETVADWTEFLRFDASNDTARNNRRVASGVVIGALWRQGRLNEALEVSKANIRDAMVDSGSPSALRGVAFGLERYANVEADLGRVTDIDASLADGDRLRAMAAAQVDPENYFREVTPVWNQGVRADVLLQMGRVEEALNVAREVESKLRSLQPRSGAERWNKRDLLQNSLSVQTQACLLLRRWADAARAGRTLVDGRPGLDDTSDNALDLLASDRSLAAVALARNGEVAAARSLWTQAEVVNRQRRSAGARDYATLAQSAMLALGRGLMSADSAGRREAFSEGLAAIAAMPAEPQKLRSVRTLKTTIEQELAAVK